MPVSILVVDDHQVVREGVITLLSGEVEFEIVGQAANGQEAVNMAKRLRPDIVLMDVTMPEMDGVEATRLIRTVLPKTKILVLSMRTDRDVLEGMLMVGANGFLPKECKKDELVAALRSVAKGEAYLDSRAARLLMSGFVSLAKETRRSPTAGLTEGEISVLRLIAEGRNTKEIAAELSVSIRTIDARRRNVMEKTGSNSVADLVKLAIRSGISNLDS